MNLTIILYLLFGVIYSGPYILASLNKPASQIPEILQATIPLSQNLYVDIAPVSNANWKLYMFWNRSVFGLKSKEYISCIPDSKVWLSEEKCLHKFTKTYFTNIAYDNFPVIGVSQEQSLAYSIWRTDRIVEKILIEKNILVFDKVNYTRNYFSLQKLMCGNIVLQSDDLLEIEIFECRLPNIEERAIFSNSLSPVMKKDTGIVLEKIDYCSQKSWPPTVKGLSENKSKIIQDNNFNTKVKEWQYEKNSAYGRGWKSKSTESLENDFTFLYKPDAETGFRNIIEKKVIKIKTGK